MTEETIKQLEELEAKATPGPWTTSHPQDLPDPRKIRDSSNSLLCKCWPEKDFENAEFITELRNNAKALLQSARENIKFREALEGIVNFGYITPIASDKSTAQFLSEIAKKALKDE